MGTQIDGILRGTLFKDFKITVNYSSERIRIERSEDKNDGCRKCSVFHVRFKRGKPLIKACKKSCIYFRKNQDQKSN